MSASRYRDRHGRPPAQVAGRTWPARPPGAWETDDSRAGPAKNCGRGSRRFAGRPAHRADGRTTGDPALSGRGTSTQEASPTFSGFGAGHCGAIKMTLREEDLRLKSLGEAGPPVRGGPGRPTIRELALRRIAAEAALAFGASPVDFSIAQTVARLAAAPAQSTAPAAKKRPRRSPAGAVPVTASR